MEVKAVVKYVRISPFKARSAVRLIKGRQVDEAMVILDFTGKRSAFNCKECQSVL